jgi:hypothetical protein
MRVVVVPSAHMYARIVVCMRVVVLTSAHTHARMVVCMHACGGGVDISTHAYTWNVRVLMRGNVERANPSRLIT